MKMLYRAITSRSWHTDRGLGLDEECQAEDGSGEPPDLGGGRNADAHFHGQKRSNDTDTHASTTNPGRQAGCQGGLWNGRPALVELSTSASSTGCGTCDAALMRRLHAGGGFLIRRP